MVAVVDGYEFAILRDLRWYIQRERNRVGYDYVYLGKICKVEKRKEILREVKWMKENVKQKIEAIEIKLVLEYIMRLKLL